ncbi:MAG: hypothetical protein AB1705_14000 [Verrucomicrobiota bacterium]
MKIQILPWRAARFSIPIRRTHGRHRVRGAPRKARAQSGSILLTCLILASVMGMTLASYLSLVSAQSHSVARSQAWNSAIPVVEGGIEEALAHLHHNGTSNLASAGWTQDGAVYSKWRQIGDSWVFLTISNAAALFARLRAGPHVQQQVGRADDHGEHTPQWAVHQGHRGAGQNHLQRAGHLGQL